jgi:hypothetical protein
MGRAVPAETAAPTGRPMIVGYVAMLLNPRYG